MAPALGMCYQSQRFHRSQKMRIVVILLSLTALGLSSCQGNRLNGSTSSSVVTGPLASLR
jgi:hypothetical protein